MANTYKDKQIEGLEVLCVLGEDQAGGPPSQEYCKAYAEQVGFPPERMVIDASWTVLFEKMASGGSGGIGLPWDGVLDGEGMVYVYNSQQGTDSPFSVVDGLLSGE